MKFNVIGGLMLGLSLMLPVSAYAETVTGEVVNNREISYNATAESNSDKVEVEIKWIDEFTDKIVDRTTEILKAGEKYYVDEFRIPESNYSYYDQRDSFRVPTDEEFYSVTIVLEQDEYEYVYKFSIYEDGDKVDTIEIEYELEERVYKEDILEKLNLEDSDIDEISPRMPDRMTVEGSESYKIYLEDNLEWDGKNKGAKEKEKEKKDDEKETANLTGETIIKFVDEAGKEVQVTKVDRATLVNRDYIIPSNYFQKGTQYNLELESFNTIAVNKLKDSYTFTARKIEDSKPASNTESNNSTTMEGNNNSNSIAGRYEPPQMVYSALKGAENHQIVKGVYSNLYNKPTLVKEGSSYIVKTPAKGVFTQYLSGSDANGKLVLNADKPATRAEVIQMLYAGLNGEATTVSSKAVDSFSDLTSSDWYVKPISWAYDAGFLSGYEDGTVKPTDNMTLVEFASLVSRIGTEAHHVELLSGTAVKSGVALYQSSNNKWYRDSINKAADEAKILRWNLITENELVTKRDIAYTINQLRGNNSYEDLTKEAIFSDVNYSAFYSDPNSTPDPILRASHFMTYDSANLK
ncbi:MAG: S-layer homology domain-containing protein [Lachnospirales bacterium]